MENPYKKISKINPQREDGNRQIANDVYIALIMAKLSGAEYQAIMFIIHKTWGFNKLSDKIGYSQMIKIIKLTKPGIINVVKNLEIRCIVVVDRKVVKGSLPVNEYLFNKYYDTWLDKTGQPMFTTLEIEQIRKNSKVVKNSLPVKYGTGKQIKTKLVNRQKQTGKPEFTHKRNYTKETVTKETKILPQIEIFISQFPSKIREMVGEFCDIAKLENKTKTLRPQRKLRLVNELWNIWSSCIYQIEQNDFKSALQITINNEVPNTNYLKKVKDNIVKKRSLRMKKGKENKEIAKEAVNGYSRNR